MRIHQWVGSIAHLRALQEVSSNLEGPATQIAWPNFAFEARPLVLASQYRRRPTKCLLITPNHERGLQWQAKLALCGVPESQIFNLPSGISSLFEDAAPEVVALSDRLGALRFLINSEPGIVIATPQAALERTLPRDVLEEVFFDVEAGATLPMSHLKRNLRRLGYEVAEPVRIPGQYSQRGGIFDLFPSGHDYPIRVEFFGDEVESLREFDPNTQRSLRSVAKLHLGPSRETLFVDSDGDSGYGSMIRHAAQMEMGGLSGEAAQRLEETIAGDADRLEQRVFFDRLDLYRPLLHPDSGCALDLLPEGGIVFLDEPSELDRIAASAEGELADALTARASRGEILYSTAHDFMLPPDRFGESERLFAFLAGDEVATWLSPEVMLEGGAKALEEFKGRAQNLAIQIKAWKEKGQVWIATDQPSRAKAVLGQVELFPAEPETTPEAPGLYLIGGNLAGGFHMPSENLALITDQELFGVGRLKLPQRKFNEGVPIATVLDLKPGDYVVHINFGIGVYRGLTKRTVDGIEKEFLFIQYQAPDKLYVPADQLDRIQKYLNPGDSEPKLNRLTGGEWQRAVGKAREEAREFARDLIKLYAQRKKVSRQSLGPDSPWQAEMEATFPWVETPSQMKAILETKKDLQLEYPMDRLVCGDVGFGKTEVAIRAAFKVAQSGKQVAVLCPTTILSEQHFRNFVERLAPFPIRLELLNRFRSAAERREVLAGLEAGEVDIVIGTHALLGKELKFKELGLVVIDEEQKFGVKQKEALKALRVSVDVLTMSATPIPRTLSMALMDIRQMSLINDPPPGRLPIRTFVRSYSQEVVREAILRELARGGQVYYVYNRVQGIYHVLEGLKKLVPQARIAVGHGQMTEQELEPVMIGFIKGEIDVLLSTTIVENGLDIANANTLIVDNADRLGLSQLYQLRGRVGRSDRQAYAYLLYEHSRELTEGALARLQSLQEFSSLGSGYSLAFRDLQIRGAGELLGSKQSGTMATVGYELFTQIIGEEVQFLRQHADDSDQKREYRDPLEGLASLPSLDLPVAALIPESYVPDQAQRLYCYKQLMSSRSAEEVASIEAEISDRYGRLPIEVQRALSIMRLRIRAAQQGIDKVDGHGGRLAVTFGEAAELSPRFFSLLGKRNRECYVSRQQFIWPFTSDPIAAVDTMLSAMKSVEEEIEAQRAEVEA